MTWVGPKDRSMLTDEQVERFVLLSEMLRIHEARRTSRAAADSRLPSRSQSAPAQAARTPSGRAA